MTISTFGPTPSLQASRDKATWHACKKRAWLPPLASFRDARCGGCSGLHRPGACPSDCAYLCSASRDADATGSRLMIFGN